MHLILIFVEDRGAGGRGRVSGKRYGNFQDELVNVA
jgi:hypothetical protein